jgi:hypothetical protein
MDPLSATTDYQSGYQFGGNNPVSSNDPTGQLQAYPGNPGDPLPYLEAHQENGADINNTLGGLFESQVFLDAQAADYASWMSWKAASYWSSIINNLLQQTLLSWNPGYDDQFGLGIGPSMWSNFGQNSANTDASAANATPSGSVGNSGAPFATYPVWDASGGEQIGQLDLLSFGSNDDNYGIHILIGYEGPDADLNWTQAVTTSYAIHGHEAGVPFADGYDPQAQDPNYSDPYYYSLNPQAKDDMYVGQIHSTGYWGELYQSWYPNDGPYDFFFGDRIGRGNVGFTWEATLSLVIMGPNNQPSSTLATFTYGFSVDSYGNNNSSQPTQKQ